jgi:hypothetical protein
VLLDVLDRGLRQALQQRDPLPQRLGEVELTAHRSLGHLRDPLLAPGVRSEQLDHLALHERGVHVHDDEALRAAVQRRALHRDVDVLDGGLGDELAAQAIAVPTGHEQLEAHDRVAGQPCDPLDVRTAAGDARGHPGDRSGAQRLAEDRHVVALRAPAGSTCRHRLELDGHPECGGSLLEPPARVLLLLAEGHEQAEDQAVADDDLLHVEDAGPLVGEDVAEPRREPRAVPAGDGDEKCAGVVHRHQGRPDEVELVMARRVWSAKG